MFERFTDRARRGLVRALEEVRPLHHNFIRQFPTPGDPRSKGEDPPIRIG